MTAHQTREELELAIENALRVLDALDGEPDFETGGDDDLTPHRIKLAAGEADDDEPSLCGVNMPYLFGWADTSDREGPDDDEEPSLGSIGAGDPLTMSQAGWWLGRNDEREGEHDGCEPGNDDEPNLGSSIPHNWTDQSYWCEGVACAEAYDECEGDDDHEPWLGTTVTGGLGGVCDLEDEGYAL